jgi:hypothetical protein
MLCLAVLTASAADYCLATAGIDGGSSARGFEDQIEVSSFSWNVFNTPQSVPEPGQAGPLLAGFGLIASVARRRPRGLS